MTAAGVNIIRVAIDVYDTLPAAGVPWFAAADKTNDGAMWYVDNYGHRC